MKSHIQLVSTVGMSRAEWLAYRQTGIGASEVGTVLGLNDYKSSLELYYQKIGLVPIRDMPNVPAFMGLQLEDLIARLWSYWDGTQASVIENGTNKRAVRKCRRVRAYVRNPKYPWLFVSLDRLIPKANQRGEGNLEMKSISRMEANKWQGGVPPGQIAQVNTQMMVPELEYTELAQLQDGRWFEVLPIEPSVILQQSIAERTYDFWERVLAGRKHVNKLYHCQSRYDQRGVDGCNQEIDALAPEPDGTIAYTEYLTEKFKKGQEDVIKFGTLEQLQDAQEHISLRGQLKEVEEEIRLRENRLKNYMGLAHILDFGQDGKIYWGDRSDGKRIFNNRVKISA